MITKKALVTGASKGIGKAIALALAKKGVDLVLHFNKGKAEAEETADDLRQYGGRVFTLAAELSDVHQAIELGEQAWQLLGGIDYLINNAGVSYKKHFLDYTLEDFEHFNTINFKSTLFLTQTVARKMVASGIEGSIYTITSVNAIQPGPGQSVYGATKGALETLMKGVALELAPHNIKVNTFAVGAVQTDMNASVWSDPEKLSSVNEGIPMGRFGQPDEIAAVVCDLLSSGTYMTGSTIKIDGGWLLGKKNNI